MRLAVTIHSLEGLGGTETYVSTLGDHLQRNGHEVWVYASGLGKGSDLAEQFGLRVVTHARDLPSDLDAAIPQDAPAALDVNAAFPELPQIFVSHTELFDVGLPPQVRGSLRAVVTLYERAHDRVLAQAIQVPVERLRQPVDIERFKPTSALPAKARTAVAFGNYLSGPRLEMLQEACRDAGIELQFAGAVRGGLELRPENLINQFDIVFGKAKIVHEAMGCGRAVFVIDHNGAEGWVTADNYESLVRDNFGGRSEMIPLTVESLASALRDYDPAMGLVNRDFIVAHHDAIDHAAALTEIVRSHVGGGGERLDPANVGELARMARVNWRHQSDAFQTRRLMEMQSLERGDALWRAEVAEAGLSAERARSEALELRLSRTLDFRARKLVRRLLGR